MSELQDLEFKEQHDHVRHALRALLPQIKPDMNPRLTEATLTGDFLWNEERQHGWVGVRMTYSGVIEECPFPRIKDGEFVLLPCEKGCGGEYDDYIFMRYFSELAEFDSMTESEDPIAMRGIRYANGLEAVHAYYEEN